MQRLPIGIQTFENIIKEWWLYVDKTKIILDILENWSKYNFLSRPRRFGKSLIVSTLKAIFEGKRDLFKWLYIYDKRNRWRILMDVRKDLWFPTDTYMKTDFRNINPVIKVSFWSWYIKNIDVLNKTFKSILLENCHENGILYETFRNETYGLKFKELIAKLHEKTWKQVVILIDEYDKPILDNITRPELAKEAREELKNFYSVIKDCDAYIRFVFITWVSKFSKVSLFSGLNNLEDLTLNPAMWEICGFTEDEITKFFPDYLEWIDRDKMRTWYNGCNFLWDHKVYNPFDVLLFLKNKEYENYWFETATPTFLIQIMKENQRYHHIPNLLNVNAWKELIGSFDIENLKIETLLFQAGYLTIKEKTYQNEEIRYLLEIPNLEIRMSLHKYLFSDYLKVTDSAYRFRTTDPIYDALRAGDVDWLIAGLKKMFAGIAYSSIQHLAKYEGYYCAVMYTLFYSMGIDVIQEDITSMGRIDLTVKLEDKIYIIELKVEQDGPTALQQITTKNYADKYHGQWTIFQVGINFSFAERNIESWEVETDNSSSIP